MEAFIGLWVGVWLGRGFGWLVTKVAKVGLHASSGKSLPGVLLRVINRLSMSGSR